MKKHLGSILPCNIKNRSPKLKKDDDDDDDDDETQDQTISHFFSQ